MVDVTHHLQRLENLRTHRSNWDAQWEEAAARLIPAHRNTFTDRGGTQYRSPGQKKTELLFDSTAALALSRFASVIESLATPQGQTWHRLVPADESLARNRQVKVYLDRLNSILFRHRYRSAANFVGQIQKTYMSYGAYGNGLLFVDGDLLDGGLRYKNLHLGEVYVAENHQGVVDTAYRSFHMTIRQIIDEFSEDGTIPESIRKMASDPNKMTEPFEIVHAVYPRDSYDPERRDGKGMPFASVYIFVQEQKVLREGGYNTFPAPMMRYSQFTGETYGRGPAQVVLPSIKVLNEEKKTVLKQGHRVVDPVLLAHDDGVVGTFSLRPGAMNIGGVNSQGRPLIQPLPTGNLMAGKEMMDDERAVINDAFLITLFQILVEGPSRMTATEVLERTREKGMLIAPTTGRLQSEFLGPLIEREIDVLEQQDVLPPPPPILAEAGGAFEIEFDAPMSRMARSENAAGFMRSLDTALAFFEATQDPSPLDWFDFDTAMPAIQDINGAPTEWTRTAEEVAEIRRQRAQQQEMQQAVEAAPALASAAKTISGTMDES